MIWVKDKTGRFAERPHFEPEEIDRECEAIVELFLRDQNGEVAYPISTDDLILMLENAVESVDHYVDFDDEQLWGHTRFGPGKQPVVRIARRLSEDERYENPRRMTIAHEFFHVRFHGPIYELLRDQRSLFAGHADTRVTRELGVCNRKGIESPAAGDWMEWQAGRGAGALLMPREALRLYVIELKKQGHSEEHVLVHRVAAKFAASPQAAQIRLSQLNYLGSPDVEFFDD